MVGPDRPLVASVAYDLPVAPEPGLAVDASGYAFAGVVERPLDALTLTASVPAQLGADCAWMTQDGLFSLTADGDGITGFTPGGGNLLQVLVTSPLGIPALGSLVPQPAISSVTLTGVNPQTDLETQVTVSARVQPSGSYSYVWSVTVAGVDQPLPPNSGAQLTFTLPSGQQDDQVVITCTATNSAGASKTGNSQTILVIPGSGSGNGTQSTTQTGTSSGGGQSGGGTPAPPAAH